MAILRMSANCVALVVGICRAQPGSMAGWKSVDEVIAYQVSVQLRREVLRAVRTGPASKDWDFRGQIRKSARSAPANIDEGFYRYHHGEFAYHTNVAKASLAETMNHLQEGIDEGYFSKEAFKKMWGLADRAFRLCSGLLRHLLTSDAPAPYWSKDSVPPKRKRRSTAPSTKHVAPASEASEHQRTQH